MARLSSNGLFSSIRFVLSGFDSVTEATYRTELTQKGGVDLGMMSEGSCTHLIVSSGRVYDDPICVLARSEGKIVVNENWVDDSLNLGILADPTRILYRPVKDMNGIRGCESLLICLTGYQKQERMDIMRMVSLMGARYSKALMATQVTHLICYKFEGQKYELAKKVNIKLVNQRWIEDCLKAWEIQPINNHHTKSGHELEILETRSKNIEEKSHNNIAPKNNESALVKTPAIIPLINNSYQSGTNYEFITPQCKESKADSCETQLIISPIISNMFANSSVSSNETPTSSEVIKKSECPIELSSNHSVDFSPDEAVSILPRKRKLCYGSSSDVELERISSFSKGDKDDSAGQKIQEGNVGGRNLLGTFCSKLFTFFKK